MSDEHLVNELQESARTLREDLDIVNPNAPPLESLLEWRAAEAIKRLQAELAETKDDYLRVHKDKMDLFEQLAEARAEIEPFQNRVAPWMQECFGPEISSDRVERNHRFLEEALELVQACGAQQSEAHELVDYVYGRETGEAEQEAGGVMVTLAALCLANGFDMSQCGETELKRIWGKIDTIRAKQAAKPKNSPLPQEPATEREAERRVVEAAAALLNYIKYSTGEFGAHNAELIPKVDGVHWSARAWWLKREVDAAQQQALESDDES